MNRFHRPIMSFALFIGLMLSTGCTVVHEHHHVDFDGNRSSERQQVNFAPKPLPVQHNVYRQQRFHPAYEADHREHWKFGHWVNEPYAYIYNVNSDTKVKEWKMVEINMLEDYGIDVERLPFAPWSRGAR